ncbi:MAG: hypothetical protein FWD99_09465 [Oscillospiraceae bacterium]|nr:hypothetical protein [Oscillospiraceae bacterium]
MRYEDVNKALLKEFPAFTVDNEGDFELPYIVAGLFTDFILEAYKAGNKETYIKSLHFIEMLHTDKVQKVRELATIDYLESIQNTWSQDLLNSNIPFRDLGEESKKWWIKLNNFWNGDKKALREDDCAE